MHDGFLLEAEGKQLFPEEHHHREDCPQLNDHHKQVLEGLAHVEADKKIDEVHVPRAGDGEPFGDALHDPQKNDLEYFQKTDFHAVLPFRLCR